VLPLWNGRSWVLLSVDVALPSSLLETMVVLSSMMMVFESPGTLTELVLV
jgi:hypothetical protein